MSYELKNSIKINYKPLKKLTNSESYFEGDALKYMPVIVVCLEVWQTIFVVDKV